MKYSTFEPLSNAKTAAKFHVISDTLIVANIVQQWTTGIPALSLISFGYVSKPTKVIKIIAGLRVHTMSKALL